MPLRVSFPVGLADGYIAGDLELTAVVHHIQADFEDGDHLFTSQDFELGTVRVAGSRALIGRLTFRYSYNSESNTVTVCGTDYPSADGMAMMTMPSGMEDAACFEHAAAAGFLADEVYRNGKWNYYSPLMPGAPETIKGIVRGASDALIASLKEVPDLFVQVRQLLPELSAEDFQALSFVSREGRFLEVYDPTHAYRPDDELHAPTSTYGGTETWQLDSDFANVIGSTPDPRPPTPSNRSWLNLWERATGRKAVCTSIGFPPDVPCRGSLVGGHIIRGEVARQVRRGSNEVRIFPICRGHNGRDQTYMQTRQERNAVVLHDYLERPN